jgi:YegS/Rv2252/BmrU family lipid kinase
MITVIINPIAGGGRDQGRRRRAIAQSALASCGEPAEIRLTERRGHAREIAADAVARGARLVLAWGGDGTINEVGSALMSRPAALGIVPAGSGNGLARELAVPRNAVAAIARACRGRERVIDAGLLGGRPFFNIAGIGFDAHIASRFDRAGRRGLATYLRVSARELLTYRCAAYRIDAGGAGRIAPQACDRALIVTLANSPQFGNGARIAPAARLDDGKLDLVVFAEVSRLATICSVPRLFTGRVARVRGLSSRQVERATIESDAPMAFHVDGEPVQGGSRLEAQVVPGALRLVV